MFAKTLFDFVFPALRHSNFYVKWTETHTLKETL